MSWSPGEIIVRREVLNDGRPWLGVPVRVVEDAPEQLVTYIATGAQFGFVDDSFPTPDGRHPWHRRRAWTGHGMLMVQRPGDGYAVWHFWEGPTRTFRCWYINLQEDARRTEIGYDTQDLELDIVVAPRRTWALKDQELLAGRVTEGRYTQAQADEIVALGSRLVADLDAGRSLWDDRWSRWSPDWRWGSETLPVGWPDVPTPPR